MSSCGSRYILPRELTISPNGTLQQHPVVELKGLRQGPAVQAPPGDIANGAQIEVLVQCKLPAGGVPKAGVVGVTTLVHSSQVGVSVGYDFSNQTHPGFATVPVGLGNGLGGRTDRAPLREALQGNTLELQVFVDGQIIETFFNGKSNTSLARSPTPMHACLVLPPGAVDIFKSRPLQRHYYSPLNSSGSRGYILLTLAPF